MKTLKAYCCIIPSDLSCVCNTVKQIIEYLSVTAGPIDEGTVFEIKVVLNELLVNAIKHGNREVTDKSIKINAGITKNNELYIIVEDEGEGYNYMFPGPCEKHMQENCFDYLEETGRGIFIVKNLCEKVKFNNKGNKVVILKKILKECIKS